jgi:fructose-specific phosphotransferase system IIA component
MCLKRARIAIYGLLFLSIPLVAHASESGGSGDIIHRVTYLVLQLGIILFAARLGGIVSEKLKFPSVLGELFVGIIIGPYLLGGLSLPAFPHGVFPLAGGGFPISVELYGFAVIASIILLFITGLETDLSMFLRCSVAGSLVGIAGVVSSFVIGDVTAMYFLDAPFMDPRALFLGAMSTATSVGITARILSERQKMDSPEGVTILAGAVIDDVLGIIILAVVLGISAVMMEGGGGVIEWASIEIIALKAVVVWLGFTVLGLLFAHKISKFLKVFKNVGLFSVLALGLALILAGIFEKAGLAMIVGAYVMGLSLSKTDLSYVIQDKLHGLYTFFVPVFFTVMGMLVNVKTLGSKEVLIFGLVYSVGAIIAKMGGCFIPPLFLNFNRLGAYRIGLGMVPRGEVALIIAGIGLARGILDDKIFGVSIIMTLITTIIAPPLLNSSLKNPAKGTKTDFKGADTVFTTFSFPSEELTNLVVTKVIHYFEREGFFIHRMDLDVPVYKIRSNKISITLSCYPDKLSFETFREDVTFINTMTYEALLELYNNVDKLKELAKPEHMRKDLVEEKGRIDFNISKVLDLDCIVPDLKGETKEEVITELVEALHNSGKLLDKELVLKDIWEREESMSTGMECGVAIPHGKSNGINKMTVAIGLKQKGIDFESIDGELSTIFTMVISPKNFAGPHVQFLATISSILSTPGARNELLACKTAKEVWELITGKKDSSTRETSFNTATGEQSLKV